MSTTAVLKEENQVKKVEKFLMPDKVLILPISPGIFRLGLESTKEKFLRLPGTSYTWEPTKRGNKYQTGLNRISQAKVMELQKELGYTLNDEFYETLSYKLDGSNPNGHILDLNTARNIVIYLAMTQSHLIAESKIEARNGSKPEAEWYIENKEADAESEAADIDKMTKAIQEFGGISHAKKRAICKIFQINVFGVSDKVVNTYLWKKITDKPTGAETAPGKRPVDRFLDILTWSDEKINVYEEVEDAIARNILRRNSANDWMYADENLGSTKEQVISKLLMGENQGLRAAIQGKISFAIQ